jgi:hypothetical protein
MNKQERQEATDRTYDSWANLRSQKGRGSRVCQRWSVFENFVEDMGLRTRDQKLIIRNPRLPYSPSNCFYGTHRDAHNCGHARNRMICWKGRTLSVADWERALGWKRSTLATRLHRGWKISEALARSLPIKRSITIKGKGQ